VAEDACDLTNIDFRGGLNIGWKPIGLNFPALILHQAELRGIDFLSCQVKGLSMHSGKVSGGFFSKPLFVEEISCLIVLVHGQAF